LVVDEPTQAHAEQAPRESRDNVATIDEIRAILKEHGRLATDISTLTEDSDLYQAGLTSHASVNIMLALEAKFDIEFPDRMLKRSVFESLGAIRAAVDELTSA
jgi:acyl carrier protein